MKRILVFCCVLGALVFSCSDTDDTPGGPSGGTTTRQKVVGTWDWSFPFALPVDTLFLVLNINESPDTYRMEAEQRDSTILIHSGTWSVAGESITFTGSDCSFMDSISKEMKSFDCDTPITFPVSLNADGYWIVPQSMLLPVISAINPDLVPMATQIPAIAMKKR